jgi:hypothetical protein
LGSSREAQRPSAPDQRISSVSRSRNFSAEAKDTRWKVMMSERGGRIKSSKLNGHSSDDLRKSIGRADVCNVPIKPIYRTTFGAAFCAETLDLLRSKQFSKYKGKFQLAFTSPPFPLNTKKK